MHHTVNDAEALLDVCMDLRHLVPLGRIGLQIEQLSSEGGHLADAPLQYGIQRAAPDPDDARLILS